MLIAQRSRSRTLSSALVRLTCAIVGFAAAFPTRGEELPPRTVWQQVERAELIVVGDVAAGDDATEALIQVREAWKGTPADVLHVAREAGLVCPAPGRFVEGKTALLFLSRVSVLSGREDGRWHVEGLSYGTLYPTDTGLEHHRVLVRKALALLRRRHVTDAERVAWALEAASHPETRWHGLYLLRHGDDDSWNANDRLLRRLTAIQRAELARGFAADPTARDLSLILPLVDRVPDAALDAAVVRAVDELDADPSRWYDVEEVLPLVARRFGLEPPTIGAELTAGAVTNAQWDAMWARRGDAVRAAWAELRTRIRVGGR